MPGKRGRPKGSKMQYIIPNKPQTDADKGKILARLPQGSRVFVRNASGTRKYREHADVRPSDTIIFKKDGTPVIMKKRPGRKAEKKKKKIKLKPADDKVAAVIESRDEFIEKDPLVLEAKKNCDSPQVLQETVARLSEVASSLAFERKEAERKGEGTSMIARREVAALVALRDASLKRIDQRLRKQEIDLESLAFRNLFIHMVETFMDAMDRVGVPEKEADSVIANVSKLVDTEEWKSSAIKTIQGGRSMVH
jgi:hypothetical protein